MKYLSPRSGGQRKAWGVSPRVRAQIGSEPAERVTAVTRKSCRPLRGLGFILGLGSWGSATSSPGFTLTSAPRTQVCYRPSPNPLPRGEG